MGNQPSTGAAYHSYTNAATRSSQADCAPPPVSAKKLSKYLDPIAVTADDLLEETNKECVVCLGEQLVGDPASKLPCGHLFHVGCVEQWLRLHCTCPVCRFELETDDRSYESGRKDRMHNRKLRFRRDELDKKSISALKEIMGGLNISSERCIDKRDLVDALVSSGCITLVEGAPALEMTQEELARKTIHELKSLMLSFGISSDGALEKGDLIRRLVDSGRVVIIVNCEEKIDGSCDDTATRDAATTFQTNRAMDPEHKTLDNEEIRHILINMKEADLINLLQINNINSNGTEDKFELINRFMASGLSSEQLTSRVWENRNVLNPDVMDYSFPNTETDFAFPYSPTETSSAHLFEDEEAMEIDSSYDNSSYSNGGSCTLSVKELKEISVALAVDLSGCLEKDDIIGKLKDSGHILC